MYDYDKLSTCTKRSCSAQSWSLVLLKEEKLVPSRRKNEMKEEGDVSSYGRLNIPEIQPFL